MLEPFMSELKKGIRKSLDGFVLVMEPDLELGDDGHGVAQEGYRVELVADCGSALSWRTAAPAIR